MLQAVIFDLDGTLWDACRQTVEAWNLALGGSFCFTVEKMRTCMGKTKPQIAGIMMPELPEAERLESFDRCYRAEIEYLSAHGGTLYDGLEDVLRELRRSYSLSIVSNSEDGYVPTFLSYHKLWDYFADFEMNGRTGLSKGENIRLLMERNRLTSAVYVGDAQVDLDAADFAAIPFIYAAYGFGSVNRETPAIRSIAELPPLLAEMS